ncbi:hypothetical protein ARHIZOSPH14_03150 [Agromyces rhizosphaerae]|uniref:Large extracellular alpha-helical protein n=1 Tax=Agromyces rhizosphaerae TaxID=88374 RepID=A0A9W6FQH3_9MICO|nr:DUF5719 family protein [Agromyces rhizosphaerae]GLI26073.1 hypothetical protein ARHIZOSPH14_03150 [Agromyces rhizosphaerae]
MTSARTIALVGARIAAGVLALGVGAATIGVAAFAPVPEIVADPPSVRVVPADSREVRACAGPVVALAEDAAAATTATALGSPDVVAGPVPADAAVDVADAVAPDVPGAAIAWFSTEPGEVEPGMLAAASSQETTSERVAGFAASACVEPAAEAWLVGGAVSVGRTSVVSLVNVGDVAATVRLDVHSELGLLETAATNLVVAPGTQRLVALAGIAPDARSPVVHVVSTGGRIAATLQQSIVRGLDPDGVEIVGPGELPATELVIAGVARGVETEADPDHAAEDDVATIVRLLAPGDDDAEAVVAFHDADGGTLAQAGVTLRAGLVADVPVPAVGAARVDVRVSSDVPVVAAARSTAGDPDGDGGSDFAWYPAAPALDEATAVAIAPGPSPRLVLASDGDAAEVRLTDGAGAERTVSVPAGGSASVAVSAGDVLRLDDARGVHASVTYEDSSAAAAYAVLPPGALDAPLRVYPR